MDTLGLVALSVAAIWKIVDAIKLQFPQLPAIVIQAIAWILGIALAYFLRETQFAVELGVGDLSLDKLNWATTALFGFGLGSATSSTVDLIKAVDNSRSSKPGVESGEVPPVS